MIEKEVIYLKSIVRAIETEKEKLQQKMQILTDVIERFRSTILMSLRDFTNKLNVDLNLFASKLFVRNNM